MGQNKLYTCFIDFKKAFNSIWHEGMFYKMEVNGFSGKLLELIRDIYKKTKCAIKIKDSVTEYFDYTRGGGGGGGVGKAVHSVLFFLIFM